jgi:hypothetical protein
MITHATTAFGVASMSIYIHQPVAPKAIAIYRNSLKVNIIKKG